MANPTPKDDEDPPIIIIIGKIKAAAKEWVANPSFWAGFVLGVIAGALVF